MAVRPCGLSIFKRNRKFMIENPASFEQASLDAFAKQTEFDAKAGELDDSLGDNLDLLSGVSLRLSVEVGSTRLPLSEVLKLGEGSVVELDKQANDYLDIYTNGTLIARGEIVTTNGRYGVKVVEVVAPKQRVKAQDRRS